MRRARVDARFGTDPTALVLVVAPAGFGKTTAVADWVESTGRPVVWLDLGPRDDDLGAVFGRLAAALEELTGRGRLAGVVSASPDVDDVEALLVSALLEDLQAAPDGAVVVLEDCHHLTDPAVVRSLREVVDRRPEHLTLVLTSRSDPPLRLARLRAAGRLTEIRARDLAFDRDESAELLEAALGRPLAIDLVDRLHRRVEGWAIGLRLAALSLVGRSDLDGFVESFDGSDRYVAEYLLDEVIERERPEIRRFLMETSLLDEVDADSCAHVTGMAESAAILEDLVARNVFVVPLGPDGSRLRYHQLVVDLLRARMHRIAPEREIEVLRAAVAWCESKGDIERAVGYSIRAGDVDVAAGLAERHGPRLLMAGQTVAHRSLLRLFDETVVTGRPSLLMTRAWGNLFVENPAIATRDLALVERIASEDFLASNAAAMSTMRAIAAWFGGDADACRDHSRRSLELLAESDVGLRDVAHLYAGVSASVVGDTGDALAHLELADTLAQQIGNHYGAFSARIATGAVRIANGDLDRARFRFETALDLVAAMPDGGRDFALRGAARLGLGLVAFERFDLEMATDEFRRSLSDLRKTTAVDYTALAYRRWSETASLLGRHADAADILTEARAHLAEFGTAAVSTHSLDACEIRNLVRSGDLDTAIAVRARSATIPQRGRREFDHPRFEHELAAMLLELALGRITVARERLAPIVELAAHRMGAVLDARCAEVAVQAGSGDGASAVAGLAAALEQAAPGGWIRPFLTADPSVRELLSVCRPRDAGGPHVRAVLDAADAVVGAVDVAQPLVDPLTPRELEVLGEIAAGYTNAQIAERLYISVGTTKRHVANIFMKLPASHRAEAVARARELGILS